MPARNLEPHRQRIGPVIFKFSTFHQADLGTAGISWQHWINSSAHFQKAGNIAL